jgi:helicase
MPMAGGARGLPENVRKFAEPFLGNFLSKLYPPQEEAIRAGAIEGKNVLLCSGTGSGKTLVAELASIATFLSGKKVVYITPLRALAGEKHEEFKKYSPTIRSALSIGGLDESDERLGQYDVIFLTTEKLDALMRHRTEWLARTGLLVVDEIHEIGSDRGPTLESVIVKFRKIAPKAQVLALSATVGNAEEMAKWLGAKLVKSSFRPVPLREGILVEDEVTFSDKSGRKLPAEGEAGLVLDCLAGKHQSITFLNTRRSAEKSAEEMAKVVGPSLSAEEKKVLSKLSSHVLDALPSPTTQCEKLAECLKAGTAFHHAGLVHSQKVLVEQAFREGLVKFIGATVTLVAGMNLPARMIIIRGLVGWGEDGPRDWPVSLYKQAVGRAGRPKYDTLGESVIIAKSDSEADLLREKYIKGAPEDVYSRLGAEPILRREALGAIASGFAPTRKALLEFFSGTFSAHQYGNISAIRSTILAVLQELSDWGFVQATRDGGSGTGFVEMGQIDRDDELVLTKIGRRVAELYLDPLTGKKLLDAMAEGVDGSFSSFGYLAMISDTFEMRQGPSVRAREEEALWLRVGQEKFLTKPPEPWDLEAGTFIRAVKLATALESWMNEVPDREIMEEKNIAPGDLRTKLLNADWVCYSACELAKISGWKKHASVLSKLRIRLEHGVKEELLYLIMLPGIGRVKARRLWQAGLKTPEAVLNSEKKKLSEIVGDKTAEKLLKRNG